MGNTIIKGYSEAASDLLSHYEAISQDVLYAPVKHFLPKRPSDIIDIGAGTGRDAARFASQGHQVLAVEPAAGLREAGRKLHPSPRIEWLDCSLPSLSGVLKRDKIYDFIFLSAVWHHLDEEERSVAMPKLKTLLAPQGTMIISIRQGPGTPSRPVFQICPKETIQLAKNEGLRLIHYQTAHSIQPENQKAGVTWDWLVFNMHRLHTTPHP